MLWKRGRGATQLLGDESDGISVSGLHARAQDIPDLGTDRPDYWWAVPEHEREKRIKLTPDTCIINNGDVFIRGVIQTPILGTSDAFGLGVRVSQKRENFFRQLERSDTPEFGPSVGWLCTRLSCHSEDTPNLKTIAQLRGQGLRPLTILEPSAHRLSVGQREGISLDRAWEIAHHYLMWAGGSGQQS